MAKRARVLNVWRDKQGGGNSWNSAHPSRGCSQPNPVSMAARRGARSPVSAAVSLVEGRSCGLACEQNSETRHDQRGDDVERDPEGKQTGIMMALNGVDMMIAIRSNVRDTFKTVVM